MSDANKPISTKDQKRLETRGQGINQDYQPFVQVQDFSSSGESIRVRSSTVGRVHHLLSGLEFIAYLVFDWCSRSIDIREQYPIPIEDSLKICCQLGIRHPQVNGELTILTTDLLIDFDNKTQLAVAVKYIKDLADERVVEKLQIEKSFWGLREVEWRLFTEKEVSDSLRENMEWIRPYLDIDAADVFDLDGAAIEEVFLRLSTHPQQLVSRLCGSLDDQYQIEPGHHISVLRYAIAHRCIEGPLEKVFHSWRCDELKLISASDANEVSSAS